MTDKTSGAGTSEYQAGAAFLRDRGADLRRALTSPRARHVWTGAVALAVTGGVLVSASASVPVAGTATGTATSAAAGSAASAAASGATGATTGVSRPPAGTASQGQAAPTGTDGVTVGQVLAVLERAERRLRQSSPLNPRIAQAAAELGMLYTTYQAQQLALGDADGQPRDGSDPASGPASDPASGPAGAAETTTGATSAAPVLRFVTDKPSADAPAVSRPPAEQQDADRVTFDEVAVAAMRLANMLDPTSPTALVETRPDAESSLRRSLQETVAAYGDSTAGYANGRIPADVLCPLPFAPGHMLRCDAAERLTALSAEFEKEFGYPIPLTDSYRPYAMQVAIKGTKPHLAAIPGTSNHGWGLAIDLDDPIAGGSSPEYVWLRLHAPDYGWDNPSWARLGGAKPEPWHFEFFAAGSIPNRAIDPSDVGTWSPVAPVAPGGDDGLVVIPASARAPGEAGAPSEGTGADDAAGSEADGGAPAKDDGSTTGPADPGPAKPTPDAPAEPAPSKPAPSDPPEEDPDAPADTGVVGEVVDDTVELVDGTVDGVVGGLVGGLLGTD
ncbi:D-alanyl-D-alanine carboxypeptidase family protein [Promicromonospora sp. NPDC057138]|uniref:D-alanyl-D-alanine carboxypeptidase family protein n=1 Tax=Promicromonospora sp. NPDC057138 TaxID=3346031 RepID=UPI0036442D7E